MEIGASDVDVDVEVEDTKVEVSVGDVGVVDVSKVAL